MNFWYSFDLPPRDEILRRPWNHLLLLNPPPWCSNPTPYTAQKMKLSIKNFVSNCDQICSFLCIRSQLLKKFLMENCNFCAVPSYWKTKMKEIKSIREQWINPWQRYIAYIWFACRIKSWFFHDDWQKRIKKIVKALKTRFKKLC